MGCFVSRDDSVHSTRSATVNGRFEMAEHWCGGWLIVAVISLALCQAGPGAAQISNVKQGAGEIVRPPIIIVVQAASTAASLTVRQTVKLGDVGSAESIFTWPVNEARSKPINDLDGHVQTDTDGKPLEMTRDKKAVVSVDWSTERFSRMNPIDISVTVNRPGALRPGVYRADIWADLNSEADAAGQRDELSRPLKLRWPVFIFVRGRSIKSIAFDDPKPRVGRPAGLSIDIETVGCDLGDGRLQLDAGSTEQDLQLGLHVLLNPKNFKLEFIDPERMFHKDKFQAVNENWRSSPLLITNHPQPVQTPPELSLVSLKASFPRVERHLIQVAAGDYYQPGLFRAGVDWPQADVAPTQPRTPLHKTARTAVLPGIRVFPGQASESEGIDVLVVADGGLPKQFQLFGAGPNLPEIPFVVAELPLSAVAGQAVARQFYSKVQTPAARGMWAVGWPRPDKQAQLSKAERQTYQALEAEVGQPTTVNICYKAAADLAGPLRVFASPEPIWWPFYFWDDQKAKGWEYTRLTALTFTAHPDNLKLARITEAGWLEVLPDARRIPYDSGVNPGPVVTISESAKAAAPASGATWKIPENVPLVLNAHVSLYPKDPPNPERHRLGTREFVWRAVLTGQDSNNQSVARIIEIPIKVVVSTSWDYDSKLYLAVVVILAIVVAVVVLHYIGRGKGRNSGNSRQKGGRGSQTQSESAEDNYFGSSAPADAGPVGEASESRKPTAKPEDASQPAEPLPPTMPEPESNNDDVNDYFK